MGVSFSQASSERVPLPSPSVFDGLDGAARASLEAELIWFSLRGGSVLFREGDPPTGIYIVVTGGLGVILDTVTREEPAVRVHPGEMVGEYSLLLGRPQRATCIAVRDTSLLWLSRESYTRLVQRHPEALIPFTAQLIELFGRALTFRHRVFRVPRTVALVPLHPGAPVGRLAAALAAEFAEAGQRAAILDRDAAGCPPDFFHAVEIDNDLVIYCGDSATSDWVKTCIRQSDRALLAANAATAPQEHAGLLEEIKALPWRQAELLLLHEENARHPSAAAPWLNLFPLPFHSHVRLPRRDDIARLARHLMGRSVGLVLSGGGARGFAHIGVVKALREAKVPIDLVGGASMGAIVAAEVALGWDDEEIRARMHTAFVRSNPLDDYAFPLVALIRGRKVEQRLRRNFGGCQVEDTWRPYFAVASNLSTGEMAVLRRGPLWRALRASIAIPGLLPPVIENGDVLADGGVMNNLPCDVMDAMRRGPVIGVDVTRYRSLDRNRTSGANLLHRLIVGPGYEGPGIVSLLMRAGTVGGTIQTRSSREHADLVLDPPLQNIEIREWHAFDRAIELGYRYTMERLEDVQRFALRSG